jgi:hypothetical protein
VPVVGFLLDPDGGGNDYFKFLSPMQGPKEQVPSSTSHLCYIISCPLPEFVINRNAHCRQDQQKLLRLTLKVPQKICS